MSQVIGLDIQTFYGLQLRFRVPKYGWDPINSRKCEIGYVDFISESGHFLTGLCDLVISRIKDLYSGEIILPRYDVSVGSWDLDARESVISEYLQTISGLELRYYIAPCISALFNNRRGIWKCATNAGKTYMAAAAIRYFQDHNSEGKVLFLVPPQRSGLVYQTEADFKLLGVQDVSIIKASDLTYTRVVIASAATLHAKRRANIEEFKKWALKFDFLFYDECHELPETVETILGDLNNASIRCFMSGTPFKEDKIQTFRLMGLAGKIIYEVTNKELIDNGWSAEPHVILIPFEHVKQPIFGTPYGDVYREFIVENARRNYLIQLINGVLIRAGLSTLVTINWKAHGDTLLAGMDYVEAAIYSGKLDFVKRAELVKNFGTLGGKRTLLGTVVMDVGISTNSISGILIADAGQLAYIFLQKLGRGIRKKNGKNVLIVVDIQDRCRYLSKHSEKRAHLWKTEDGLITHEIDHLNELSGKVRDILNAY